MAPFPNIPYTDPHGRERELVIRPGAFGSLLVLDRDLATMRDRRLLAHIPSDEPPQNAALVCRLYLQDSSPRSCRPPVVEDFLCAPFSSLEDRTTAVAGHEPTDTPFAHGGLLYGLRPYPTRRGEPPELRWSVRPDGVDVGSWQPTTLRDVLTAVEDYEPMRALTLRALTRHRHATDVSVDALRRELARLQQSAFVLNRGLREAVIDAVERRRVVSMSEVAVRCGMVKRDRRGARVGDTTWLARRVGLMPEGGKRTPARWVRSDVLGLIARRGLGLSPREVELG